MVNKPLDFVFPNDQGFSALISSFQNAFSIRLQAETICYRIFFDTVDWLLYNNGSQLEMHEDTQSRRVYWRPCKDAQLRIQLGVKQIPQLGSELPEGVFREQLTSVVSVRELTPKVKIKIKRVPLLVLNKNGKVVVRINLDENWFYPTKSRAGTVLSKRITIKPVKGYDEACRRAEQLVRVMELRPATDNLLKLALAESGSSTTEHTTKLNLILDPEMSAEKALKSILLRLLQIMQQNREGSIRGKDTEFMHDYRVSIRKTRSALSLIKDVLPRDETRKYSKFFSAQGKLTNPVRDLDVFLLKLDDYQEKLSKNKQAQLKPLQQYLVDKRSLAQKQYIEIVKSPDYRQTVTKWRGYLESTDPVEPPLNNTQKPVHQLANELIWETYQLALAEGNAITDETEAEAVHELRKTCKKLRYLMEFFQSLYPAKAIKELIKALKELQDNLGDFNDYHVHIGILKDFRKSCSDQNAVKAVKKLINSLKQKQQKTRNSFSERFKAFAHKDNQDEFRALFTQTAE